jgi:hypothetical protein
MKKYYGEYVTVIMNRSAKLPAIGSSADAKIHERVEVNTNPRFA